MTWVQLLIFLFVVGLGLIMGGFWIAAALGLTGIAGLYISGNAFVVQVVGNMVWNTANNFTLTAIPLFLFMGEIILCSGLSERFYKGIVKFLRKVPGGLLHSNIVACAIFSAISGSSVATAAGIGSIAIPEMKRLNYKNEYIYGSVASGGTLGILIPPSIPLIIYGSLTTTSTTKLFMAAIVPGLVLMSLYILFLIVNSIIHRKEFANVDNSHAVNVSWKEALLGVLPMVVLVLIILGSIYAGIATATEAAALGTAFAIAIGFIFGDLKVSKIWNAAVTALKTTSMILFIMIGAQFFAYVLTSTGTSRELISWLVGIGLNKWVLFGIVCVIYIILGCFMDGNSMQYLTIPILFPVLMEYGFDPIWFGIVLVVLIEMGQITPPMGMNLFVIRGIDKTSDLTEIIRGVIPYLFIMMLMIIILAFFPNLAQLLVH